MMFKRVAGVAVCAAAVVGFASPAFAGEWSPGNGLTPIKTDGVASSECAFSGRDEPDTINGGGEPADPELGFDDFLWAMTPAKGNVQSPGQLVATFGPDGNAGVPGTACRGGG